MTWKVPPVASAIQRFAPLVPKARLRPGYSLRPVGLYGPAVSKEISWRLVFLSDEVLAFKAKETLVTAR